MQHLHIAVRRVQEGDRPLPSDPWKVAIFHTGWEPRMVLQTPLRPSRCAALNALREMLGDGRTGEYEWPELLATNTTLREFELVQSIKRRGLSPLF
jgi:hypothetical protein